MNNIYLFGRAGSGKDTFAMFLSELGGYEPFSLGALVRETFNEEMGRPPTRAEGPMIIQIAEGYKKIYGCDYWAKRLYAEICEKSYKPVVVVDGRFHSEYDLFVKQLGYVPIKIEASSFVRNERISMRDGSNHRRGMEKNEDEVDEMFPTFIIDNDLGHESLKESAMTLLREFESWRRV